MDVLANPTIEHVTVVNEAGWVTPVISLGGVLLTALVTLGIFWFNVRRSDRLAATERTRHEDEIERLEQEAKNAKTRHDQQIEAMLKQGRRERGAKYLGAVSDHLVEIGMVTPKDAQMLSTRNALRLRQFALKAYADFSEDDPQFAEDVAFFLDHLANRVESLGRDSEPNKALVDHALILLDAQDAAAILLKWLDPRLSRDSREKFAYYREHKTWTPNSSD